MKTKLLKNQPLLIFPHSPQQWLKAVAVVCAVACVAHLSIMGIRIAIGATTDKSFLECFFLSLIYTTIIILFQTLTGEYINRKMPISSKTIAVFHIIIQSISAAFGFLAAQQVEIVFFGKCIVSPEMNGISLFISFLLSFIGNTTYYISFFYRQAKLAQQRALASELSALRAQINPHFLFNTLNSIAALIRINPDEAETVTEQLAELFRYSLRASERPLVTLEEEVSSVQIYLSIEEARFRERLYTSIILPESLKKVALPSLLLQPLVENSIKHGANIIEGPFSIKLICSEHEGIIIIRVEDNGHGFNTAEGDNLFLRGTGLSNVRDRLSLAFPGTSAMKIEKNAIVLIFPSTNESNNFFVKGSESTITMSKFYE